MDGYATDPYLRVLKSYDDVLLTCDRLESLFVRQQLMTYQCRVLTYWWRLPAIIRVKQ